MKYLCPLLGHPSSPVAAVESYYIKTTRTVYNVMVVTPGTIKAVRV